MIQRFILFAFAMAVALPATAEKISVDYGIRLVWTEVYSSRRGFERINFYATDIHTNREYVIPMMVKGRDWAGLPPQEFRYNPDVGGRPIVLGPASDDVRDRIYGKMSQEQDNFRKWLENKNLQVPETPRPRQGGAVTLPSPPSPSSSQGLEFPEEISGPSKGDSDWNKLRAQQTPYVVGATLNEIGWGSRAQYELEKAQNQVIKQRQQMVDSNLAANLEYNGIENAKVKAEMLVSLYEYMKGPKPGAAAEVESGVFSRIDLTEEGRKSLQEGLARQRQSRNWSALAKAITILANPWSGSPSDPALRGYADSDGIMIGPAIKRDSLKLGGRKSMVHRIRQVANRIQAYALQDDSWKSGRYIASVVGVAGMAVQSSAVLENLGIKNDAEKLLGFAEAAAEFLNGTDEGIVIGITESVAGSAILAVEGYEAIEYGVTHPRDVVNGLRAAAEFFGDPRAVAEASNAILGMVVQHAPVVLAAAWNQVVDHVLHDSPRERGRLLGRVVAEVGMDILTGEIKSAVQSVQMGKLGSIDKAANELSEVVLRKADKVAARSAELSQIKNTTGPYVRALPDLKDLAALESNAETAQLLMDFEASFQGHIFKGNLNPGDVLFQVQRADQIVPGHFFTVVRPADSVDAEDMLNIFKYRNDAAKVTAYVVREPVSVYAGAVAGGSGHQILIPSGKAFGSDFKVDHVVEAVETLKLHFRNNAIGE